jgi:hypothetical protein
MGLGKTAKSVAFRVIGRSLPVSVSNAITLARSFGQYQSAEGWSYVNAQGQLIPWYTYPTIEYFDNFKHDVMVLKCGSGNSSLYYLNRGGSVISVEDNCFWYDKIKAKTAAEHKYHLARSAEVYVCRPEIADADIAIDWSHRPACSDYVIEQPKENAANPSMIVSYTSDRFPKSFAKRGAGLDWVRVNFCRFGPINAYTWVASIFLNPNKKLPRMDAHISSISETGENAKA